MITSTVACGNTSCYWRYVTGAVHHSLIIGTWNNNCKENVECWIRIWRSVTLFTKNVTWTNLGMNRDLDTAKVLKEN